MNHSKTQGHTSALDQAIQLPSKVLSMIKSLGLWHTIKAKASILQPIIAILALGGGVLVGAASDRLSEIVSSSASALIDGYSYGAPAIIFVVLAPVLARIFSTRQKGRFGLYVVGWLAVIKLLAMLWAIIFTVAIFGLPIFSEHSVSLWGALVQTIESVLLTLTVSHYFWAIYASIAIGLVALKVKALANTLEKGVSSLEHAGQYFQFLMPAFMFTVGVYVQALPQNLGKQIGLEGTLHSFHTFTILGLHLDPNTPTGMVMTYTMGALAVAVGAFGWHFAILALAKYRETRFSFGGYFKHYWVKAYPLLWSTSSESLATPLNLYILKKHAAWVRPTVRRLVAGTGSVLSTDGTLICVFVLLGLVGRILGIHFSLFELLLAVPVAFLISYGIPGIPGELLLFAGPLAMILPVPPELAAGFLALYLGLQVGLPDSFRTGANTTNNYVYCILLSRVYEERFQGEEPRGEE